MGLRFGIICVFVVARTAHGEPWRVTGTAGTDFPLDVGAGALVESPSRVRISTSLGVMPGAYVDTIDAFLVGIGALNDEEADLVRVALKSSLIWRTHVGWRPWTAHGFYGMAGYSLIALGGSATGADLIAAATDRMPAAEDRGFALNVHSTLHLLDAELGWEWQRGRVVVRAALGGVFTVAAHSTIARDNARRSTAFAEGAAAYLDDLYTSYVDSPVVTVMTGYRF